MFIFSLLFGKPLQIFWRLYKQTNATSIHTHTITEVHLSLVGCAEFERHTKEKARRKHQQKERHGGEKPAGLFQEISNSSRLLEYTVSEKAEEIGRGRNNGPLYQAKEPRYYFVPNHGQDDYNDSS